MYVFFAAITTISLCRVSLSAPSSDQCPRLTIPHKEGQQASELQLTLPATPPKCSGSTGETIYSNKSTLLHMTSLNNWSLQWPRLHFCDITWIRYTSLTRPSCLAGCPMVPRSQDLFSRMLWSQSSPPSSSLERQEEVGRRRGWLIRQVPC